MTTRFDHPIVNNVSTYEKLVAWASTEWCKGYAKEKGGHMAEMAKHMGWSLN